MMIAQFGDRTFDIVATIVTLRTVLPYGERYGSIARPAP
jgi:hypothetical protein